MEENECRAIVEKIITNGRHGPYAVARREENGALETITFSLNSPSWNEDYPDPGTYVILSDIRKKRNGWRAMHGRFMRPSDEKNQQ